MALGLLAAYDTIQSDFHVHRLTAQFFQPGVPDKPLAFEIIRCSDKKNNASRIIFISQEGTRFSMMTIDFIRRPILDGLSLEYQAQFPEVIEPPDDEIEDDLKFYGKGLLRGQNIGRLMSEYFEQ
jgi:acyl-CoA thioesterase